MGSVEPYETSAGRRYRVRYRDAERKQRERKGFTRRRDADEYLAEQTVSLRSGTWIDPSRARATVGDLGAAWLASRPHLKPSTARVEESTWRIHVEPAWGARPVAGITHSEVQSWVASIGRSPTIVRHAHAILAAVLEAAVRDRRISANPARQVRLPRKVGKDRVYLSHEQVEALARESGERGTLVRFLAYTGLRWGEATGLLVRDLESLRGRVQVRQNAVAVGGQIIVGTPKSHKMRSVPFPAFLSVPLARECEGKGRDAVLFGNGRSHLRSPDTRDGWFAGACRRVRDVDNGFPESITLHDLRHTAASLAISAGANVKAVQRMLGHASAAMTLDTYADLFDDDLDAVATALDAARSSRVVGDLWAIGVSEVATSP